MKNILSDENNFKRAIKYVAKYNRNNPNERYNNRNLEKSASPLGRRPRYKDYPQNTSPLRKVLNITREPLYRYENTISNDSVNDIYQNRLNNKKENNRNNKEEYYDIEISSINENGMPQSKSPEQIKYKNNVMKTEDNDDDIK